jgi:hypothetical protein
VCNTGPRVTIIVLSCQQAIHSRTCGSRSDGLIRSWSVSGSDSTVTTRHTGGLPFVVRRRDMAGHCRTALTGLQLWVRLFWHVVSIAWRFERCFCFHVPGKSKLLCQQPHTHARTHARARTHTQTQQHVLGRQFISHRNTPSLSSVQFCGYCK